MNAMKISHDEWVTALFKKEDPPPNALTLEQLCEKIGLGITQTKTKIKAKVISGELVKKNFRNKNYYWPANENNGVNRRAVNEAERKTGKQVASGDKRIKKKNVSSRKKKNKK